jgi:hypothetical protein
MFKAVYDTDNDGVVDKAETVQIIVRNSTGVTLTKGQIVYLSGATGNRPNAVLAQANSEATSSKTIGWVTANINNNSDGYVGVSGSAHDLNTSAFTAGDALWLSPTVAGGITSTVPVQPNHAVFIGYCARSHPTQGRIVFKIQNGYELQELHNVLITSIADNDGLFYESSTSLWKNKQLPVQKGSFGVTVDGVSSVIQIGQTGFVTMPYAGTITGWSITTNAVGSVQFDVWKDSLINVIPTVADSIVGGVYPTLTTNQFATSTLVTSWTTSFSAGHIFGFYVNSATTVKNATLTIFCNKL